RRRVVVYVFDTCSAVSRIFGASYYGTALRLANAIVVVDSTCVEETERHELVHLFAARWNSVAPPLWSEGIAVWLQRTVPYRPMDWAAGPLLANRDLRLSRLLKPEFFFAPPQCHACYVLAGSFTGFLIRRYGWDRYRWFYRASNDERWQEKFRRC